MRRFAYVLSAVDTAARRRVRAGRGASTHHRTARRGADYRADNCRRCTADHRPRRRAPNRRPRRRARAYHWRRPLPRQPQPAPAPGRAAQGGTLQASCTGRRPPSSTTHLSQGTKDQDAGALDPRAAGRIGPDGKPGPALWLPRSRRSTTAASPKTRSPSPGSSSPDVKWSDGTAFTADDVVFTWQYIANPKTAATDTQTADGVTNVEAQRPHTVKVTFKDPNPYPYQIFVSAHGPIMQKKQFQHYHRRERQGRAGQPGARSAPARTRSSTSSRATS